MVTCSIAFGIRNININVILLIMSVIKRNLRGYINGNFIYICMTLLNNIKIFYWILLFYWKTLKNFKLFCLCHLYDSVGTEQWKNGQYRPKMLIFFILKQIIKIFFTIGI